MNRRNTRAIVDSAFELFDLGRLLNDLRRSGCEFHLVGGAVRDAFLTPGSRPADIDLMTSEDPEALAWLFRPLGTPRINRHGNFRFELGGQKHLDLICTRRFYGQAATVQGALHYFDSSVNAVAIDVVDGRIFDPLHGLRHIQEGRTALPLARWTTTGDRFEDVHVLLRLLRLVGRTGLRVIDAEAAQRHRSYFDLVDWDELRRLNGFGRAEAERRFDLQFAWADRPIWSSHPVHVMSSESSA